jgi:hypothetical protein
VEGDSLSDDISDALSSAELAPVAVMAQDCDAVTESEVASVGLPEGLESMLAVPRTDTLLDKDASAVELDE